MFAQFGIGHTHALKTESSLKKTSSFSPDTEEPIWDTYQQSFIIRPTAGVGAYYRNLSIDFRLGYASGEFEDWAKMITFFGMVGYRF